jgi:hypothetical protein
VIAFVLTIVGGVAVYWLTTGVQNSRQREDEQRRQAELFERHQVEEQQADAARRAKELEDKAKLARMSEIEMDVNRDGSDYKDFVAVSIEECLSACERESQCKAITFTKSSRQCWMKSSVPLRSDNIRYISAVKIGS